MATPTSGRPSSVLFYGMNYAPEPIGIGKYACELAEYLAGRGMRIEVVTAVPHYPGWRPRDDYRNGYRKENINGIRVSHCPLLLPKKMRGLARALAPFTFALSSAPVAVWQIIKQRPDIIYCVEPTLLVAPLALLMAKLVGARVILHVQDLEIDAAFAVGHLKGAWLHKIAVAIERALLRAFDHVATISGKMHETLLRKGVQQDRLSIVRNWVDLSVIKRMPGPSPLRKECGITENSFVVLYSGNIGLKQGLDVIPKVARLLQSREDIVFVVAGAGPEKMSLEQRCRDLPNVRFLPLQPADRLCALLNMADVHILPQLAGTVDLVLPSKLGGMLASGKHCIVMADAGTEMYEFLQGVVTLVPQGAVEACANAILELRNGCRVVDDSRRIECLKSLDAKFNLAQFYSLIATCENAGSK